MIQKIKNIISQVFKQKKYEAGDYQLILAVMLVGKTRTYDELIQFLINEGLTEENARLEIAILINLEYEYNYTTRV